MSKNILLALPFVAVVAFFARKRDTTAAESTAADTQTRKIVTATTAFLNSLSVDQRAKVQFPFAPQKKAVAAKGNSDNIPMKAAVKGQAQAAVSVALSASNTVTLSGPTSLSATCHVRVCVSAV
jgi:hypothetical protein